jgi:hypothetical protein
MKGQAIIGLRLKFNRTYFITEEPRGWFNKTFYINKLVRFQLANKPVRF